MLEPPKIDEAEHKAWAESQALALTSAIDMMIKAALEPIEERLKALEHKEDDY
jgi:hypothetical protein